MKKLLFITLLLLSSLTLNAQRCVVLDFQIGTNVTEEEVKAVSYEFRSNFNPSCYTVEDYFKVKNILKDLNFDVSNMKKDQIRDFGREMIATIVVYGSLSKYMEEYSLDILIMDISSGTTALSQNTTFQKSEYREKTPKVSKEIASKLCNISTNTTKQTATQKELMLDEGRYVGDIVNGKPHGKGKLFYKEDDKYNRVSYEGDWVNGERSGNGTLIWKSGEKYTGNWKNNNRDGYGTDYYPNGKIWYKGEWKNGKRDGKGVNYYQTNDKYNREYYEGNWVNGERSGNGTLIWKSGSKYVGEWKNGKIDGYGTYYYSNNDIKYKGDWKNNKWHGSGTWYIDDGRIYTGQFIDDKPSGYGTLTNKNGRIIYSGIWYNGEPTEN